MSPRRHGDAGGSLRVFGKFMWLEVGSAKVALSRPAHQRVTQAVGQLLVTTKPLSKKPSNKLDLIEIST